MTSRGLCERKCEKGSKSVRQRVYRELADSGCVKVVVGWILVILEETGCRGSCERRHGVGVNNGVKRGSEEDCYLKLHSSRPGAGRGSYLGGYQSSEVYSELKVLS